MNSRIRHFDLLKAREQFFTGGSLYMFAQDVMRGIKYRAAAQECLLQEAVAKGVKIGMKKAKET